jgi:hypothetical protein
MNEKCTAKQEKHAKRWRKENEIFQRLATLYGNIPSAIIKEVENGLLEYKHIEGCDDFYFIFTLDRRCNICYSVKPPSLSYLLDSKDENISKIWHELSNRITLELKKGR